ncbi:MAG TPA: hypothetical protein VE152_05995, partial [Acidimicrobiales bacterium]|nr:hypothetical protein [Acidimicrobiales bacterium]
MTNLAFPSGAPGGPGAPHPPVAPRRPRVLVAHGDERVDDWYWLAERDNPEVLALLEAENAHTDARCAHTDALAQQLYREMVGRVQETDLSVPARKGPFRYYSRTRQGAQYPLHCRRPVPPGEPDAPGGDEPAGDDEPLPGEQVILD